MGPGQKWATPVPPLHYGRSRCILSVMVQRGEQQGLRGVGFLFAMILLFLAVMCLKQTGHADLAEKGGLAGAILLEGSGWFLLRKSRHPSARKPSDVDGDVAFTGAVLLLCLIMVAAGAARMLHVPARALPLILLCLSCAGLVFRRSRG